jgi:hypothetical protein
MARTLEVVFRHRPLQTFDCEAILGTCREVFRRNGIDVDLKLGDVASSSISQMQGVRVNGCTAAISSHLEMFSSVAITCPDQIVVFIVAAITDPGSERFAGCAAHPADKAGVVITEAAAAGALASTAGQGRWVLAHELAHVLGLDHRAGTSALMTAPATAITSALPVIDSTERSTMEASRYLGRGFSDVTRSTPERTTPERSTPSYWDRPRSYFDGAHP